MTYLTRHVFRALLANEPILHRDCLRRRGYRHVPSYNQSSWRHATFRNGRTTTFLSQRRTFFDINIFGRKRRDLKDAEMDPGIEKMMELAKRQRMRARLPPREDIAEAFLAFIQAKRKSESTIEDTQAELLLRSLKYCTDSGGVEGDSGQPFIRSSALGSTALVLAPSAEGASRHHKELMQAVYELSLTSQKNTAHHKALRTHVKYLALNGQPREARDLVVSALRSSDGGEETLAERASAETSEDSNVDNASEPAFDTIPPVNRQDLKLSLDLWSSVLEGFARGSSESDLLQSLDMARQHVGSDAFFPAMAMITFYLRHGSAQQIQTHFSEYWRIVTGPTGRVARSHYPIMGEQVHRILQWCLQNNELELGHVVVRRVLETNPPKPVWDAVFVWAAATGKGVDEIARMLQVMEDSNASLSEKTEPRHADVGTINALVEFAVTKDDPYMAERFITLGRERKIAPDARTYVLQMDYRLRVGDIDGALVAYKSLQAMDLSSNEDIPTVNRLLVALCQSQRHDFDTIMNVAADLTDRQGRFDPLTVSTLGVLHLNRDEFDDVVDLLNTHAYHFSSSDRDDVRDAILAFCIDPKTPTPRSWDAYTLIRKVFDETPRPQRTEIMSNFFKRERSDMAIHVFNDMRTHSRADVIPTVDTYITAFLAAAKSRDIEALEVIHNQLKLDFNINVKTYLKNALIIAYTACGKPRKALGFWDDIVASKEGPTYNSIHVALRACEKSPFGDSKAQDIWSKLRKMKVELDQTLWASYVAALAGNGDNQLAFAAIEEAEASNEISVDSFLVGSLFAGGAGQSKQNEIEEWAQTRYPHVWEELLSIGIDEDETHMRAFRIDRAVTP